MSREELQQPVFAALDVLEYPELHDESIPFLAYSRCLARLMTASGVRDFSLQANPFQVFCFAIKRHSFCHTYVYLEMQHGFSLISPMVFGTCNFKEALNGKQEQAKAKWGFQEGKILSVSMLSKWL